MLAQDERTLPMKGTIVGVETTYIVQWDNAETRLCGDGKRTHSYPPEALTLLG
jgi:hypothetical protein